MHPDLIIPPDCLRPVFTEQIANLLLLSRCVNVYGEEGHGLGRLVDDLSRCCPQNRQFVRISMKSFADSYDGFILALCDALGLKNQENLDLRAVLNRYLDKEQHHVWLCLEYFDRLAKKKVDNKTVDTKGFDLQFLNYLNSLNNNPRVSLLLTSSREIATQELNIGGQRVRGSRLDISQRHALEDLTFAEIESCLERTMPAGAKTQAFFQNKPAFFTPLIAEIAAHGSPLFFLESITHKIPTAPNITLEDFNQNLLFWKKDYATKHAKSTDLILSDWEHKTGKWLDRTSRMLGISKMLRRINKKIVVIIGVLASILFTMWNYGEQLAAWVANFFSK